MPMDRQQRSYNIVETSFATSVLSQLLAWTTQTPPFPTFCTLFPTSSSETGWLYNTASHCPPRREGRYNRDSTQHSNYLNWTGPLQDYCLTTGDSPSGCPLGAQLRYLNLPSDMPGAVANRRASVTRCKPCANPHDSSDMPKYVIAELTQYVLKNLTRNPHRVISLKPKFRHPINDLK